MNIAGGFIVLHRQITQWEWFTDTNTFCLFVHLLLMANYEEHWFQGQKIERGQVFTSLPSLSQETGLSIRQTRTALEHLISTGEVTNKSYTKYRVITITNYDKYQDKRQTKRQTNDRQSTDKTAINRQHYNNNNKYNKGTNNKSGGKPPAPRFIPPTVDEVRAYCEERKNGIDPEHFVDYNEARGWVLKGGQKMKDWKAAIRTWERRDENGRREPGAGDKANSRGNPAENRSDYSFLDSTIINL